MRIKAGSKEWKERVAAHLAEEAVSPVALWYLSFAEPGRFLGGVMIEARGLTSALIESHRLGINPGGEVQGTRLPNDVAASFPPEDRHRLLSKAEIAARWGLKSWK
jgi:hypothetical protein